MENFLSNFANTNTEVTSNNANLSVSPDFYGFMDISKGALTMKVHFYARVYKMKYDNCISLDDWDIQDTTDISFGGMPIDNISALKTTMINSGLTTVANGLDISNDEHKKEICIQLEQYKMFKDIFGKKARMFNLLSNQEKAIVKLKFAVDNYNNMNLNSDEIKNLIIVDEEGNKAMPTIEQVTEAYNQLNK
jgi:hypothetical protein